MISASTAALTLLGKIVVRAASVPVSYVVCDNVLLLAWAVASTIVTLTILVLHNLVAPENNPLRQLR